MTERAKTRYQGKELAALLAAMLIPAAILYLSFVLAIAAGHAEPGRRAYARLSTLSTVALILFVPVQLGAARYLQRYLPGRVSKGAKLVQLLLALVTGLLFSLCAAMILVAIGVNVLARMRG